MNQFRSLILSLCFSLILTSPLLSFTLSERDFDQGRMLTSAYGIMVLSPCENSDTLTAYDSNGKVLWNIVLKSKVISWNLKDGRLYVFSKNRFYDDTYLHSINPITGYIVWERP